MTVSALKELYDFFPLEGITTNPTILKQSGLPLSKSIDEIKKIVGDGMIHVQVIASGLKEEDGTISAYIAQIIDLTDRRTSLENSGDDE